MVAPYVLEGWAPLLHVVSVISNTERYRRRYELYKQFEQRMLHAGVTLWTVELALGNRKFAITEEGNPHHLQLRTQSTLWAKENLINLGVQRLLPHDWEYVAWIDADINFVRPDWDEDAIHLLQRYPVAQLCSRISDLNPDCESFQTHKGFGWCVQHERHHCGDGYVGKRGSWHPGFCWAMRRDCWDALAGPHGALYDWAILGSADRYMAHAFIDDAAPFIEGKGFAPGLVRSVLSWQDKAYAKTRGHVGYLPGMIVHYWHGSKKNRKYVERWDILREYQFDPYRDIRYDANGVLEWTGNKPELERAVMAYFHERNEDSIDWEP